MPALRELQQQIACALLDDAAATTFAATLALDPSVLTIYRNTRLGTLTRALATAFPAVRALVGEDFFEAAARQFIRAEPPATACLDDYGERFAAFLAQLPPAAGIAYLADVARLEWAVNRALHAPDGPVLELAALAGVARRCHLARGAGSGPSGDGGTGSGGGARVAADRARRIGRTGAAHGRRCRALHAAALRGRDIAGCVGGGGR
jgi:hypothetical protein